MSDKDLEFLKAVKELFLYHPWMQRLYTHIEVDKYDRQSLLIQLDDGTWFTYDNRSKSYRKLPNDKFNMDKAQTMFEFGARLSSIMRRKNISQLELSRLTGISNVLLNRYISGQVVPGFVAVDKIARALNCSIDEFRYV